MGRGTTSAQQAESSKSQVKARLLLTLELNDGELNIIANDTVQQFELDGKTYLAWALSRGEVDNTVADQVKQCSVTVSDINRILSSKVANDVANVLNRPATLSDVIFNGFPPDWQAEKDYNIGDYINKIVKNSYIYECTTAGTSGSTEPSFPEVIGNTVSDGSCVWTCRTPIIDEPIEIISGKISNIKGDGKTFSFDIVNDLGNYSTVSPRITYDVSCPWIFKDSTYCKYSGSETVCNKTMSRCKELSNVLNFGGFPNIPKNWKA